MMAVGLMEAQRRWFLRGLTPTVDGRRLAVVRPIPKSVVS